MDYQGRLASFRQRVVDLGQKIAALDHLRAEQSPGVADGDKKIIKDFEALNQQVAALRQESETVSLAIEQTAKMQAEHEAELAQQDLAKRQADAATLQDGISALDAELDAAMVHLREIFERRANLIKELGATRTIPSGTLSRMMSTSMAAGAARAAGLNKYLEIEHVAPMFVQKMNRKHEVSK